MSSMNTEQGQKASEKKMTKYFFQNDKLQRNKKTIIISVAISVVVLIIIGSIVAAVLLTTSDEELIIDKLPSVCGDGHCYLILRRVFEGDSNQRYEIIRNHLKTLKGSGVGAIILEDDFSKELTYPNFEKELSTLSEACQGENILLHIVIGDLGSVDGGHPFTKKDSYAAGVKLNNRSILNYGNTGLRNEVLDILSLYGSIGVTGIYVFGLPRLVDSNQNPSSQIDLSALKILKESFRNKFSKELYIISKGTPTIPFPPNYNGMYLDGIDYDYIIPSTFLGIQGNVLTTFLNGVINNSPILHYPEGPELFLRIMGSRNAQSSAPISLYLSFLSLESFFSGSLFLYMGVEYGVHLSTSFPSYLGSLPANSERFLISNHTKLLAQHKKTLLHDYNLRNVIYSPLSPGLLHLTRNSVGSNRNSGLIILLNSLSNIFNEKFPLPTFFPETSKITKLFTNEDVEGNITFRPNESDIYKIN